MLLHAELISLLILKGDMDTTNELTKKFTTKF